MTIDKAPFMQANMTQHLFQGNNNNFQGNDTWLVNLPDRNSAEHIGTVIKNEVNKKMLSEMEHDRYREKFLKKNTFQITSRSRFRHAFI